MDVPFATDITRYIKVKLRLRLNVRPAICIQHVNMHHNRDEDKEQTFRSPAVAALIETCKPSR